MSVKIFDAGNFISLGGKSIAKNELTAEAVNYNNDDIKISFKGKNTFPFIIDYNNIKDENGASYAADRQGVLDALNGFFFDLSGGGSDQEQTFFIPFELTDNSYKNVFEYLVKEQTSLFISFDVTGREENTTNGIFAALTHGATRAAGAAQKIGNNASGIKTSDGVNVRYQYTINGGDTYTLEMRGQNGRTIKGIIKITVIENAA